MSAVRIAGSGWVLPCIVALWALATVQPASADLVLLDEVWSPEIAANDVSVTEVDTQQIGDKTQAKTGEFSALLANDTGWPNVRFRAASLVRLDQYPVESCALSLWYRTDHWTGPWRVEVWLYADGLPAGPVKALEADLDGGGPDGALVADNQWHQAQGAVRKGPGYGQVPHDRNLASYVWLAPTGGWNVAHKTYVDRIELNLLAGDMAGKLASPPARHTRPRPGAQTDGPGWIWFEGEDAIRHNVPYGGALAPQDEREQKLLSNGAFLQWHGVPKDASCEWEVNVPEAATYTFWCRAMGEAFRWAWGGDDWRTCTTKSPWGYEAEIREQGVYTLSVSWVRLGEVNLKAGKQLLQVQPLAEGDGACIGFDAWLLTRKPFVPNGAAKPQ